MAEALNIPVTYEPGAYLDENGIERPGILVRIGSGKCRGCEFVVGIHRETDEKWQVAKAGEALGFRTGERHMKEALRQLLESGL